MKRVFKYPLKTTDVQDILLPAGAWLLTVQLQHGEPMLWALVDDDADQNDLCHILIFGTGHPVPERQIRYLSTYQLTGGDLVFHVFVDMGEHV